MFRFTIRDVLWLTVVAALVLGWWIQAARHKTLAKEHEALKRRLAGMIEVVTSTGLIQITKTGPTEYLIDSGPVAKDLWKRVGEAPPSVAKDSN